MWKSWSKNLPVLDPGFVPLGLFFQAYEKGATQPLCIAVERGGGQIGTWECKVYGTPEMKSADEYYVDRLVKFLLWSWGGFKGVHLRQRCIGRLCGRRLSSGRQPRL